jgi:hypothetical protein
MHHVTVRIPLATPVVYPKFRQELAVSISSGKRTQKLTGPFLPTHNYYRDRKIYTRELPWHPSIPFISRNVLKAGRADTRPRVSSQQSVAPSPVLSSLQLYWLWPRWYVEPQHLAPRPDVIGQPRSHRQRAGSPHLG